VQVDRPAHSHASHDGVDLVAELVARLGLLLLRGVVRALLAEVQEVGVLRLHLEHEFVVLLQLLLELLDFGLQAAGGVLFLQAGLNAGTVLRQRAQPLAL